ncbi:MAG: class I SAM-dependent methyltransferase [Tepidisphaerales bacterium]
MPPTRAEQIDRLRERLLLRIRRRYRISFMPLDIGPLHLHFIRIENPDRVLDMVADEVDRYERKHGKRNYGEELHLPYWAELWDSAPAVGQYLTGVEGRKLLARRRADAGPDVLDLGCGMGLAGTTAAALGARVLFADLEPHALLFARLNSLPWFEHIRTRRLNWRTDNLGERFPLILGADILYEKAQWPHLEPFWDVHLAHDGAIVLGEPGRPTGAEFLTWIAERPWTVATHLERVSTRDKPVSVMVLRRR